MLRWLRSRDDTTHPGVTPSVSIVAYDPARHEDALHRLWLRSLDEQWAVERPMLREVFGSGGSGVVALDGKHVVGFAGTVPSARALAAILVAPEHRRRGIATSLLRSALAAMAIRGPVVVGGLSMLWKGVPTDLAPAIAFFR